MWTEATVRSHIQKNRERHSNPPFAHLVWTTNVLLLVTELRADCPKGRKSGAQTYRSWEFLHILAEPDVM